MDKSPLKTLTLEDFLESERHKLTGTLTPVTPETFAKWKKDRLDKKAAEEEARKAKEATGKAMFESGDWKGSDDESDEEEESDENDDDDDEDDDEDDDDDGRWNLETMRRETERLRALREEERLAIANGEPLPSTNGVNGDTALSDVGEEDASEGEG
jgi:hypothetical protein